MNLPTYISQNPETAAVGVLVSAICAVLALWYLTRLARKALKGQRPEDVLTMVAATLATSLAASGMWAFFRDVLHLPAWARVLLFSFAEVATIASALRARRAVRENKDHSAGLDGAAMWGFTALSALLSTLDADSFKAAIFRLLVPLGAAWLWERGLAAERHRATGKSRKVHSKFHLDRILIRLGLAEPVDRTAADVDAHRRLTRVARAAKHLRALRAAGDKAKPRHLIRAQKRLDRAMEGAVEHARLSTDPDRQNALLAHLAALYHSASLADLAPAAPWELSQEPAREPRALPGPPTPPRTDGELVALGYDAARVEAFLAERGVQLDPTDITRRLPAAPRLETAEAFTATPAQVPDLPQGETVHQVPEPLAAPAGTGSRPDTESGPASAAPKAAPAEPDPIPGPATLTNASSTGEVDADRSGPVEAAAGDRPSPTPPINPVEPVEGPAGMRPRPGGRRRTSPSRPKARQKAEPSDQELLVQARAADQAYLDEHGRHIPAEKLARVLQIRKARATLLTKQIRRPALHSVAEPPAG
ncbi:hypothetical protein [Actinomadura oligospora]|uniref:hypothetical protein n=1 Tax=Actinomadura oligospora TaxID=111804 RepID=UPI0004AFA29B|nr:hypothetical protein [Actinomadura oligospora]